MAVKRSLKNRPDSGERGQSVLEFLLLLPMLVGLTVILIRVNTAIQQSIVNQQYLRAFAIQRNYQSPVYPLLRFREGGNGMIQYGSDRMVLGVSENAAVGRDQDINPEASTQLITRSPANIGSDRPQEEPLQRGKVRIRTSIEMCTQMNVVRNGRTVEPISPRVLTENRGGRFEYCHGLESQRSMQ